MLTVAEQDAAGPQPASGCASSPGVCTAQQSERKVFMQAAVLPRCSSRPGRRGIDEPFWARQQPAGGLCVLNTGLFRNPQVRTTATALPADAAAPTASAANRDVVDVRCRFARLDYGLYSLPSAFPAAQATRRRRRLSRKANARLSVTSVPRPVAGVVVGSDRMVVAADNRRSRRFVNATGW